ncbi:hypothetical protein GQ602_006314 [Ophiocordyceps camponoti-floridani]|uniref:DHHA2 domain-containing protein n=1 Tax=Ophiocordyceps camponoti-floridani TaxID=2030778 RepID=A0A8H4Q2Y2_9HYPO|nr:hypothetical protein GQ602_006314 [Ophiocordyceps camponoti-floridani]
MFRSSLKSFLATAKNTLNRPASQQPTPLTLVVGNESADLDSLCCAIVYAYLRSQPRNDADRQQRVPPTGLHVPLSHLPRADLGLRPELTAVLAHAGLAPADLITLSELPDLSSTDESTRWILVDHNALTGPLARFAHRVVGCVDHHDDEGTVPSNASPRVIEPCGSCMSLVVDETRRDWDALTGRNAHDDDALAKLCLAPILVDTINLSPIAKKVRPKDTRAVDYLEAKLSRKGTYSRHVFYDEISAAKDDLSRLSMRDLLRKDYKQWRENHLVLGISCSVADLSALIEKATGPKHLLDSLSDWSDERGLDVAAIMTASTTDGSFHRHLLVWGRSPRGDAAVARFVEHARQPLRLESWRRGELDDGESRFAWHQRELAASRKRVGPLMREAMRKA